MHFDKLNSGTLYLIFYPRERLIYILVESTLLVNYSDCTLSLYFKIGLTRARWANHERDYIIIFVISKYLHTEEIFVLSLRYKYSRNQDEEFFFFLRIVFYFKLCRYRCKLDIISALFPFGSVLCVWKKLFYHNKLINLKCNWRGGTGSTFKVSSVQNEFEN